MELPSPYKELPDLGQEIRSHLEACGLWPMALGCLDIESSRDKQWEKYYQGPRGVSTAEEKEAHRNAFRDDAALHPMAMRIRLVTITDSLGNHAQIWSDDPDPVANEKDVLIRTFALMGTNIGRIMWVGFNIMKFDWPRLVVRALIHRIAIPDEVRGYRTRWADMRKVHINDVMEYMAQGGDTKGLTLHNVSVAYGLPGKTGDFGHDFGEAWDNGGPEDRTKLLLYNLVDDDQCLRVGLYSMAIADYARKYRDDFKMKNIPDIGSSPFILPRDAISLFSKEGEAHFNGPAKNTPRVPVLTKADRVIKLDDHTI